MPVPDTAAPTWSPKVAVVSAPPRVIVVPTFVGAVRTVVPVLFGSAPAAFNCTKPPWMMRSPVKAALASPRTRVP